MIQALNTVLDRHHAGDSGRALSRCVEESIAGTTSMCIGSTATWGSIRNDARSGEFPSDSGNRTAFRVHPIRPGRPTL